jgi:hypothetical protein
MNIMVGPISEISYDQSGNKIPRTNAACFEIEIQMDLVLYQSKL